MKSSFYTRIPAAVMFYLLCLVGLAKADGLNNNEVEFTGTISSLVVNGEGVGTIFIRLENSDLRVIVHAKTEITKLNDDELGMDDLKAEARVEITGKYSSSGILASRIRLVEDPDKDFRLRGTINGVEASGDQTLVSLLGIRVIVNAGTEIEGGGAKMTASSLKAGLQVQIEGAITPKGWEATSIEVRSAEKKKEQVRFEGTVVSFTSNSIQVAVQGLPGDATRVLLDPKARILGNLAKDAMIYVIGTLNSDLTTTAREVRVLQAFEIKPDEKKLKVGETTTLMVNLRESAPNDLQVALKAGNTSIVSLSAPVVTIAKGTKTAEFKVTGGPKTGFTEITAEALGQKATAQIRVGEVSEDEHENHGGKAVIVFAPEKIEMGPNETRDAVLLIKPPQKTAVKVDIQKATKGLVNVAGTSDFSHGAAALKVTIRSGDKEGQDSIVATLPKELGSGKAELLVVVSAGKKDGLDKEKTEIEFRPDRVKLAMGESLTVSLFSSRSHEKDVTIAVTMANGGASVEVPSTLILPAGTKSVKLTVKGKGEGKALIVAAMPAELGGDTADLNVQVGKIDD